MSLNSPDISQGAINVKERSSGAKVQAPQFERREAAKTHPEGNIPIQEMYTSFKEAEETPADPNEKIRFGFPLHPQEKDVLTKAGSEMKDGVITRKQLLDAGFIFINRIGGGEKPLINAQIEGIDFGERTLISITELELIERYQKSHPELYQLPSGIDIDDVRHDMFSLLMVSQAQPPFPTYQNAAQFVPYAGLHNIPDKVGNHFVSMRNPEAAEIVKNYSNYLYEEYKKVHPEVSNWHLIRQVFKMDFIKNACSDFLYIPPNFDSLNPKVRGMRAKVLGVRLEKIRGTPSPFLDSGFSFGRNPDVFLYIPQSHPLRINAVVLHLLSRGISEMGNSRNNSDDQHYTTLGEYFDEIFPQNEQTRKNLWESEERAISQIEDRDYLGRKIAQRFIDEAYEWKRQSTTVSSRSFNPQNLIKRFTFGLFKSK